MSASRRWDGEPETEADTRFFDLRESGYKGPVDQDGYAVRSGRAAVRTAAMCIIAMIIVAVLITHL